MIIDVLQLYERASMVGIIKSLNSGKDNKSSITLSKLAPSCGACIPNVSNMKGTKAPQTTYSLMPISPSNREKNCLQISLPIGLSNSTRGVTLFNLLNFSNTKSNAFKHQKLR